MKAFYVILCIFFAVFITIESKDPAQVYIAALRNGQASFDACRNQNRINNTELISKLNMTMLMQDLDVPEMVEVRHKVGCFVSCLMEECDIMNGTVIDIQKMVDVLQLAVDSSEEITQDGVDQLSKIGQDCAKEVENVTDACVIGWKFGFQCMGSKVGF